MKRSYIAGYFSASAKGHRHMQTFHIIVKCTQIEGSLHFFGEVVSRFHSPSVAFHLRFLLLQSFLRYLHNKRYTFSDFIVNQSSPEISQKYPI